LGVFSVVEADLIGKYRKMLVFERLYFRKTIGKKRKMGFVFGVKNFLHGLFMGENEEI